MQVFILVLEDHQVCRNFMSFLFQEFYDKSQRASTAIFFTKDSNELMLAAIFLQTFLKRKSELIKIIFCITLAIPT